MPDNNPVHIFISDDGTPLPYGFAEVLRMINKLFRVTVVREQNELFGLLKSKPGALVLLPLLQAGMNGNDITPAIASRFPKARILVYIYHRDIESVCRMHNTAVCGYMLRGTSRRKIKSVIDIVMQGGEYYSPDIKAAINAIMTEEAQRHEGSSNEKELTNREKEILELVKQDFSAQQIADKIVIEKRTVEKHLHNIYHKFEVHSREELLQCLSGKEGKN